MNVRRYTGEKKINNKINEQNRTRRYSRLNNRVSLQRYRSFLSRNVINQLISKF